MCLLPYRTVEHEEECEVRAMIPISEDELTELIVSNLVTLHKYATHFGRAASREEYQAWKAEQNSEARRIARLMLASEQMYEALRNNEFNWNPELAQHTCPECFGNRDGGHLPSCSYRSALSAAEGRK